MNENLYDELEKQINNIINELKNNITLNKKINPISFFGVFLINSDELNIIDILEKPIEEIDLILRNDNFINLYNDPIINYQRINTIKLFKDTVDSSIYTHSLISIMLDIEEKEIENTIEYILNKNDMEYKLSNKYNTKINSSKELSNKIFENMKSILLNYIIKKVVEEIDLLIS